MPLLAVTGGVAAALAWRWGPALLQGRAQFGVLREGQGGQIAIGLSLRVPDPARLDPAVLQALAGTPVTLFVGAGDRAATNAAGLAAAGHELGLLAPSSRTLEADRAALEAATGGPVRLALPARYRPLTLSRLRRAGLQAVWPGHPGPLPGLLDRAEPGGLLPLDGLSAPQIRGVLAELRTRGYRPDPVGALKGLRSETLRGLLQRLYRRTIDARFDRQHDMVLLNQRPRGLFRISRRPYDGPPLTLPDGTRLTRGTPAAELHLSSKRLVALAELSALTGLRAVQTSLHDVARALEEREEFRDAQLIYALTIFGGVLGSLGFQTEPLPNPTQARVMAVFFNLLRVLYGAKNTDAQVLLPATVWMSRETLLTRYGSGKRPAGSRQAT